MAAATSTPSRPGAVPKTLVVCCDGSWVNAVGKDSADSPPSNVSRLIRALCHRNDATGSPQIVLYQAGVGTNGQLVDKFLGGAFGLGLGQDIREMYNFICTNYVGGDSIVLVGFSRGAFTARSVADLVASVGLLTPEGSDRFYDIFDDYENMAEERREESKFICPKGTLESFNGQTGEAWIQWENRRKTQYRGWLKAQGYTRDTYTTTGDDDGAEVEKEITIRAVAVWDTVGSLGIPAIPVIGLRGSAAQWKFTNTQISRKVENAFQALALDEPRYAYLPSLWERLPDNTTTNLRQVWFPGSHSNVGGGWRDQQIANTTLAWMCDQLSSMRVGVAFDAARLATLFQDGLRYSATHPFPHVPVPCALPFLSPKPPVPWANSQVFAAASSDHLVRDTSDCPGRFEHFHPNDAPAMLWAKGARPWALGQTRVPSDPLQRAAGLTVRRPAQFVRMNPENNKALPDQPLLNTNERIHASVRVRLSCGGLGMDDKQVWTCASLTDEAGDDTTPLWRLERVDSVANVGGVDSEENSSVTVDGYALSYYPLKKVAGAGMWQWVFACDPKVVSHKSRVDLHSNIQMPTHGPPLRILPEELPTGRWERLLLGITAGNPDVFAWAAENPYQNRAH